MTANILSLPGVLESRTLRRTVQVRLGFDFEFWISDLGFLSTIDDIKLTVRISPFVVWVRTSFSVNFQSAIYNRPSGGTPILFALASLSAFVKTSVKQAAQSCKRVPSFTVSRHRFVNYPG